MADSNIRVTSVIQTYQRRLNSFHDVRVCDAGRQRSC